MLHLTFLKSTDYVDQKTVYAVKMFVCLTILEWLSFKFNFKRKILYLILLEVWVIFHLKKSLTWNVFFDVKNLKMSSEKQTH